jgi:hypothetical protein
LSSIARKLPQVPADKSNIHATLQLTFAPSVYKMHNVTAMLELCWS